MMLALILAGIAFYEVFVGIGTVRHLQGMSEAGRSSLAVMRDAEMDDDEKAVAMRRASGAMFSDTALMLVKTLLAVAAAARLSGPVAPAVAAWTLEALLIYSLSWIGWWATNHRPPSGGPRDGRG